MILDTKTEEQFISEIKSGRSIVQIHKDGCPYCVKSRPWLEELSKESKRKFIAVENTAIPNLLAKFNLKMYPTFLAIKDGVVEDMFYGDTVHEKVVDFVKKHE